MKTRLLIIFAIAMIIPITESFAEEIEIKFGETVSYKNLNLYFYDIEDSRCPLDVTCIWEGRVLPMIRISNETHSIGGGHVIGVPLTFIEPYKTTLISVEPHPITTEKPDYVATLEIEKQKPKPSDFRDLQTGETISNPEIMIIIQSLGAILIVLFIIIYAVKKRMRKNEK